MKVDWNIEEDIEIDKGTNKVFNFQGVKITWS